METFNAVMRALIFIVLTGTATVGMFAGAGFFWFGSKGDDDRLAIIIIYAVPSAVAGVISLWGMINVIYYWLIPAIW